MVICIEYYSSNENERYGTVSNNQKIEFPSLETERLNLRILALQDADEVFKHFSDEDITQYMDIELCKDIQEAEEIIRFHTEDSGCRWGLWIVEVTENDSSIMS